MIQLARTALHSNKQRIITTRSRSDLSRSIEILQLNRIKYSIYISIFQVQIIKYRNSKIPFRDSVPQKFQTLTRNKIFVTNVSKDKRSQKQSVYQFFIISLMQPNERTNERKHCLINFVPGPPLCNILFTDKFIIRLRYRLEFSTLRLISERWAAGSSTGRGRGYQSGGCLTWSRKTEVFAAN